MLKCPGFFLRKIQPFFFRNISNSHTSRKKNSFGLSTLTVIAFSISKFNNLSPNQKIPVFQWKYPPNDSLFLLMAWNSREKNTRMTRGRSVKKNRNSSPLTTPNRHRTYLGVAMAIIPPSFTIRCTSIFPGGCFFNAKKKNKLPLAQNFLRYRGSGFVRPIRILLAITC